MRWRIEYVTGDEPVGARCARGGGLVHRVHADADAQVRRDAPYVVNTKRSRADLYGRRTHGERDVNSIVHDEQCADARGARR